VLNREQIMREQAENKIDELLEENQRLQHKLKIVGTSSEKAVPVILPITISSTDIEVKDISEKKPRTYENFAKETFRKELGSSNNETPYHVACNIQMAFEKKHGGKWVCIL